jgi:hypothetical protein
LEKDDTSKKFIYKDSLRFEVTPDGLFYAPEESLSSKKYPCPDCRFCQWCADSRCNLCQDNPANEPPKEAKVFKMI